MKDLYRCLDDYPPPLLQAIAEAWQVALAQGTPREMSGKLAEAMLAPGALEGLLARLSAEAHEALAGMVRAGGVAPAYRLFHGYGAIRRLGPARLARERPWLQPANALEELLYKGLIYRAYGTVGDYYGEVLLIPQQLQERLAALGLGAAELKVAEVEPPARIQADGRALIEDILAILVHIRKGQVAAGAGGGGGRGASLPSLANLDLGPRLQGENHPERLALIGRLLARMHLVQPGEGLLRPTARAREWLRAADWPRWRSVFLAWREDAHWDELRHLPTLHLDDPAWQGNPVRARQALLQVLGRVRPGVWLSLEAFLAALKRQHPDYLRPDGDYAHPVLRDAQTGERLSGLASWDRVEGVLACHLLTWPLRWLGVVDIGYADEGAERPSALRLTEEGRALLAEGAEPAAGEAEPPVATIGEDFTITLPLADSLYERYQLERFAQWQAQDHRQAIYRLSAESIWRSQNAGVNVEQILRFLQRISRDRVPPGVTRALQEWGHRFGKVIIRKTVLLQAADPHIMQQLRADPAIRALLGEMLSPTACLVEERNVEALSKQLKALGIWPHVSL